MSKHFLLDDIDCPDLMTVSDLQHILHIGRNTAYHLLSSGQIQHLRVGRSYSPLLLACVFTNHLLQ